MSPTYENDHATEQLGARIAALLPGVRPVPGHARLLDALQQADLPHFALRLTRGGWHRPGRLLDPQGRCVADNALAWLEQAYLDAGEDAEALLEALAPQNLTLTRYLGQTHYFVLPRGDAPDRFLQLELEELDEAPSHRLVPDEVEADSVETLLDPVAGVEAGKPLGQPRYHFRRLTDIAHFMQTLADQPGKPAPVLRFIAEWRQSTAGQQNRLCDHWVFALSEHLDRYKQHRLSAVPVAARAPGWQAGETLRGTELAQSLHDYDRSAGYGFAWYFHMLSGRKVPRSLPAAVFTDLNEDLAYLPERDARLIHAWMKTPYAL